VTEGRARWARLLLAGALLVAVLVPAVAAASVVADDWLPVGDDAVIAVRAHDVLSSNTPVVGARTTLGGEAYEGRVHHLGPLPFWALAIPERAARSHPAGLVAGAALVAAISIAGAVWAVRRAVGPGPSIVVLALCTVCAWAVGRQLVVDVWNPHLAVLPLLAALFCAFAVAAGQPSVLPVLAIACSFCAQAHFVYAPLALALLIGGVIVVGASRAGPSGSKTRALVGTAIALVVVWAVPVFQQLVGDRGNLAELARAWRAGQPEPGVGWAYALRAVARAVAIPPLFARPAGDIGELGSSLPVGAGVSALLLVGACAGAAIVGVRRRDRPTVAAASVAAGTLVIALITVAQLPETFPEVPRSRLLLLWPAGCFTWFALGLACVRIWPGVARRTGVAIAGVAIAGVVAIAMIPAVAFSESHERNDARVEQAVRSLAADARTRLPDGAVRVEAVGDTADLMRYALFRELRRRGVDTRVMTGDVYLGDDYAAPDQAPTLLVVGGTSDAAPSGARVLAKWAPRDTDDRRAYETVVAQARRRFATPSVLTAAGRAAVTAAADDDARVLDDLVNGRADIVTVVRDGTLLRLYDRGWIRTDAMDPALTDRLQELQYAVEELQFVAYLVPPS
jgi:hypothetical protein